ncbi:glycosyltransferase family 2 protein [Christiangramia sabulilitoris]|uniref:Glycosyltransferase family 2 protein n=1 Tax=Christiangramia sabulilitoris TaxID=2583991 RepID=A0A550HYX7_9FLAO|nr:glycosyltransferase [Christiangramia sabulilitoris]TRO63917.1 glycosyltransferase family 2 protein [Christiangramia sabulilitoris]
MLAIIIPYYKIKYFEETLSSLARQSNRNFNVYIGNDSSPQNPEDIVKKYLGKINIVYKEFEENLGRISLSSQWERCIQLSKNEEWLMILGDDDYLSDNYIDEFYQHLNEIKSLNIKVVRFASRIVKISNRTKISDLYTHPKIENSTDFFYRKFFQASRGSLTEQIFRRDAYLKHGFRDFPLAWGTDNFAWLEFSDFGEIYSINSATAYFRISEENISRGGYLENVKLKAKHDYFEILIKEYLPQFKSYQRKKILNLFEILSYRSKGLNLKTWLFLNYLYLKEEGFLSLLKYNRRLFLLYPRRNWTD